jgi:RNA-binding protein YhbY
MTMQIAMSSNRNSFLKTNPGWRLSGALTFGIFAWFLGVPNASLFGQGTQPLQHLWEVRPDLGDIWTPPRVPPSPAIDLERLHSPETQERLDTARLLSMHVDRPGYPDKTRTIQAILGAWNPAEESVLVRRAMISAACAVDDGSHAREIWELSRDDPEAQLWVQQALIRWKNAVAIESWRQVARDRSSSAAAMRLALEGLGMCGTADDESIMTEILESESASLEERILSATALGNLLPDGLTPLAIKYLDSNLPDRDLVAIALVKNHTDGDAATVAKRVLEAGGSPAKRLAATWIARHSPEMSQERVDRWSTDPDVHFRRLALQIAAAGDPIKGIDLASSILRDNDPELQRAARSLLLEFAPNHREAVDVSIARVWMDNDPQSLQQAIVIAVEIFDPSKCERLLPFLDHPHPSIQLHAAWALRDLCEPGSVLDRILAYATEMTDVLEQGSRNLEKHEVIKLSFLLEALGKHRHALGYGVLRKYIPKNEFRMSNLARASAIWSIGQIKKNVDDSNLRAELRDRIADLPPENPENYLVRFACMLALGEFEFRDSQQFIDQYGGKPDHPLGYAAQWAKGRIAGSGK